MNFLTSQDAEYLQTELDAGIPLLIRSHKFIKKTCTCRFSVSVGLVQTQHYIVIQNPEGLHCC